MAAPKIRADYGALTDIERTFRRESGQLKRELEKVRQCVGELRNGDWIGAGASKFYQEMDAEVFPTVARLNDALEHAGRVTRTMRTVMERAEADAAALLRFLGSVAALGGGAGSQGFAGAAGFMGEARVVPVYEVQGPWGRGSSVHEVITMSALARAMDAIPQDRRGELLGGVAYGKLPALGSRTAHEFDIRTADPSIQQFIRGVMWPDDPKGFLFDDPSSTENFSTGLRWLEEFDRSEADEPEALIARSHYGDLQYFHGMATVDGENPLTTKQNMMNWSRFLTDVSTGRIDPNLTVSDVPLTREMFPAHRDRTLKELFAYKDATDIQTRQRAAGALAHMIQDSHAAGHVDRDPITGAIRQFHTYGSQDHGLHSSQDRWGRGSTLADRLQNTQGAQPSVEQSAAVLGMLDQGVPTNEVMRYLDEQVWGLEPGVQPAGPGERFRPGADSTLKA